MNVNPSMVTLARNLRGKTQTQLATEIESISQGNLSQIEKGLLGVSEKVLYDLSRNLDFPINFFRQEHPKRPLSECYYRKRVSLTKKQLVTLEASIDLHRMIVDKLLDSADIPEYNSPLNISAVQNESIDGAKFARAMREAWEFPEGPLDDICGLLERKGIIVIFLNVESEKFDGITTFTNKNQPIIFINKNKPGDRKRFTLCHELGHLVLHLFQSSTLLGDTEQEANDFASELLMPELAIALDLQNLRFADLSLLKQYWKVSMAALIERAFRLDLINSHKRSYFYKILGKNGWRRHEPIDIKVPSPKLFGLLFKLHYNTLKYSNKQLGTILNLNRHDLNRMLWGVDQIPPKIVKLSSRFDKSKR
jgi:Zn-dependent peptidase ImmA (M78 family)/transcriptional regulator with XRE-family HTH domain